MSQLQWVKIEERLPPVSALCSPLDRHKYSNPVTLWYPEKKDFISNYRYNYTYRCWEEWDERMESWDRVLPVQIQHFSHWLEVVGPNGEIPE